MTSLVRCCVCSFIIFIYWCSTVSAQIVEIPDPNLETALREALELPYQTPITPQEMLRLTRLAASKRQITDLTGLEHATNLTVLSVWGNPISDISSLGHLIELKYLDLAGCQVRDLSPLANLTQLKTLNVGWNDFIQDISPLANLTQLVSLRLTANRIMDLSPLANLAMLEKLEIDNNVVTDVSPLADLVNLMDLKLAGNPIRDFSPLLELNLKHVDIDIHMLQELASVEVEIPDPNLERAIREKLGLSDEIPLTQADMLQLGGLDAKGRQITNLTGLKHATNLTWLTLGNNDIQDLHPIAGLIQLEALYIWDNPISDISPLENLTSLRTLGLVACEIVDITPLAALTQLETLSLDWNRLIVDISPLRNLTRLTQLRLSHNRIVDVSPLANLTQLQELRIDNNRIVDFSPLEGLPLTRFEYDEVCELQEVSGFPIQERIQNRNFPSVFQAWYDILNRPTLSREDRIAHHDLQLGAWFGLHWLETEQGFKLVGNLERARQERDALLALNPNMIFIVSILMRDDWPHKHPEDWPHWIRDAEGNRVSATDYSAFLMDFTHPDVQDIIVQQAAAAAKCGLYDGIFLDWWREDWIVLKGYRTYEEEQRARDTIIRRVRAAVGDDFLIWVNPNRSKPLRTMPYINGLFMETVRDHDGGYTRNGLVEIESTLLWAEENLGELPINGLEGWGVEPEAPDSPTNRRWMRVFTAMGLTHSNGYVLYITGSRSLNHEHDWSTFEPTHAETHNRGITHNHGHDHYWYDFWDADLGRPIGEKAIAYQDIEGLFVREFDNGWAVYNRSGKAQTIALPASATPVSDRGNNAASLTHLIPDLDGEIYLTTRSFADVNADGKVNILDLVQVANGFGKSAPDPNGDGVVNILDLVFVAQQFSQ
ncbi:hypothetical protein C6502_02395 [Candidatus Poribacteria bacterium]|nr:MAG: hypothetical protein C6502_02395 [Candidatus Poribacteria bacterium]